MAVKDTLLDMHDILFEELERLNDLGEDEALNLETIKAEAARAGAMVGVASTIVKNGQLILQAHKVQEHADEVLPRQFSAPEERPRPRLDISSRPRCIESATGRKLVK